MTQTIAIAAAAFCASLVDGSLGMGFGPTATTILLASRVEPVAAAAMVNLAKSVVGVSSAVAHWRLGNIDPRLVRDLAVPGAVGAVLGTWALTTFDRDAVRPLIALVLVVVGARILVRFSRVPVTAGAAADEPLGPTRRATRLAGLSGGITNGMTGTWGPVVTPYLLHRGVVPRIAVGSVNCAEVAVAVMAVGSLVTSSGTGALDPVLVGTMLVSGVVAAPAAAALARRMPARGLGIGVGGLLLTTQGLELTRLAGAPPTPLVLTAVAAACVLAVVRGRRHPRRTTRPLPSA